MHTIFTTYLQQHFFDPGEYGWARLFIVQVMLYGVPSSFNFQICLLSSVWLLLSLLLKLVWWIPWQAQPYSPGSKKCSLCLWEKYFISPADRRNTLNSRSELVSTCRHKKKHLLSGYGWKTPTKSILCTCIYMPDLVLHACTCKHIHAQH